MVAIKLGNFGYYMSLTPLRLSVVLCTRFFRSARVRRLQRSNAASLAQIALSQFPPSIASTVCLARGLLCGTLQALIVCHQCLQQRLR